MISPDIREAKNALDKLSADPKARKLAEDRLIWEWAYYQDIKGALRQGREQGREQGLREAVRTACDLLGIALTADRNAALEAASLAALESLLDSLRRDRSWPG